MLKQRNIKTNSGSALLVVVLLIATMMIGGIAFLARSRTSLDITGFSSDNMDANYQMEAASEVARSKLIRAVNSIILNQKLQYPLASPGYIESFNNINNSYGSNPLQFLKDVIRAQAYNALGVQNTSYEFANFDTAFSGNYVDPNVGDKNYFQVSYSFNPVSTYIHIATAPYQIVFDYEYIISVRGYGQKKFTTASASESGVIHVALTGAPFSQYATFVNSMQNQLGQTLVFAGGDTSAQDQEVYSGRVHVNQTPNFIGAPVFMDVFTSGVAKTSWVQYHQTGYTGNVVFNAAATGGVPTITMPTSIFNVERLASGDTSVTAATNNAAVSASDLRTFMATYAGGTLAAGSTAVPAGIYVPYNSSTNVPTGGVFVEGDAQIKMDVVQGSSLIGATQYGQMTAADQGCKYQKFSITSLTAGVTNRDVLIGAGNCTNTYVFNTTTPATAPVVLNGRINGNVHVDGKIDQLGEVSRTRPAVAQDFGLTVSALKDVRIINDLQYEDAKYVSVAANGTVGTTTVATPTGPVAPSVIQPTDPNVIATIDPNSKTVLGILSTQRDVMLHTSAPANINIEAAIFAGNSAALVSATGLGCNAAGASTQGCGFGYEAYTTATNMGNIKFLGSLSEYKDQTTGAIYSNGSTTGYAERMFFDARLRQNLTPPAFPITDTPQAYATIQPYRAYRISKVTP